MLRGLRNILLLIVVVAAIQGIVQRYGEGRRDRAIAQSVEQLNARLPTVVGDRVRVDKAEYSNHTVRYFAVVLGDREVTQSDKDAFEQGITEGYCRGAMKKLSDAKVTLEYSIKTRFEPISLSVTPDRCR